MGAYLAVVFGRLNYAPSSWVSIEVLGWLGNRLLIRVDLHYGLVHE
ncbi:hypothetical protein [Thaumasiovibrio sp. DFM-14]